MKPRQTVEIFSVEFYCYVRFVLFDCFLLEANKGCVKQLYSFSVYALELLMILSTHS